MYGQRRNSSPCSTHPRQSCRSGGTAMSAAGTRKDRTRRAKPVQRGTRFGMKCLPRARRCAALSGRITTGYHDHCQTRIASPPGLTSSDMSKGRNPQAEQMADESMLRGLAAQASAIWPQEEPLFARYALSADARIADIGCGSGEITARLAARYPRASIVGIDILEASIADARVRHAALGPRVHFEQGDAFELKLPSDTYDLVTCRHMTQAIPEPERALRELARTAKPGGWLHILSEDYGMIHMPPGRLNSDRLWHQGVIEFARVTDTDACVGRRTC